MRLPLALTLSLCLLASSITAAPIDFDRFDPTAPVRFNWDRSYADLLLSTLSEGHLSGPYVQNGNAKLHVRATGATYLVDPDHTFTTGEQEMFLPVATVTETPGYTRYRFAPGGTWTITDLLIGHDDGTTHRGQFSATLGEIVVDAGEFGGFVHDFRFHHGQWDDETAALLGLPGHDVYGVFRVYLDFNEDDFGQPQREARAFGFTAFAVPEPSLLGLLGIGGIAALRRIRRQQ